MAAADAITGIVIDKVHVACTVEKKGQEAEDETWNPPPCVFTHEFAKSLGYAPCDHPNQ